MKYLFVFFIIFCLSIGLITFIISFFVLKKKKSNIKTYFLLFLLFYLIIFFIASISFFLELFIHIPVFLDMLFSITSIISAIIINIIIILFMHYFLQFAQNKTKKKITYILLIFLFTFSTGFYLYTYFNEPYIEKVKTFNIMDIIVYLLPLYSIILFFKNYKKNKNIIIAKLVRLIIIISAFFLPILLLENFDLSFDIKLENTSFLKFRLLLFPIHYLIINCILIYYGLKNYHLLTNINAPINEFQISKDFIKKFNITDREIQIIKLLFEGYNNKQISEKLFISSATVRNHLHNIYEKSGVSNRVELIRFSIQ